MKKTKRKPNILNRKLKLKNNLKFSNFSKDENKRFLKTLKGCKEWFEFSTFNLDNDNKLKLLDLLLVLDKDSNLVKVLDKTGNNNHIYLKKCLEYNT